MNVGILFRICHESIVFLSKEMVLTMHSNVLLKCHNILHHLDKSELSQCQTKHILEKINTLLHALNDKGRYMCFLISWKGRHYPLVKFSWTS